MSIIMWGYKKCSTCRNAYTWMKQHQLECEWREIIDTPPTVDDLQKMWQMSGLPLHKFFNTSGELYRELKVKEQLPSLTDQQQLALLAANGKLIKRPLVTDWQRVTLGFKAEQFATTWGTTDEQ
jgi:arsenate reductase